MLFQIFSTLDLHWPWTVLVILHMLQSASSQCGVPAPEARIIGGERVPYMKYPWFVALVKPEDIQEDVVVECGGSLITDRHVVTAAHCFNPNDGIPNEDRYRAIFSLLLSCDPTVTDAQTVKVSKVDVHPTFSRESQAGDLAVLTLESPVSYTPICMPTEDSTESGEATIIGFGDTSTEGTYPCTMREGTVRIYTREECKNSDLNPKYSSVPYTICAGVPSGAVDACDGDSGGPLMAMGPNGEYTLRGVVSFGQGCAEENKPGVYTRVADYLPYINEIIGRE